MRRSQLVAPLAMVLGLLLTALAVKYADELINEKARVRFEQAVTLVSQDVYRRMYQPVYGLRGAIGAVAAEGRLDRQGFQRYVAARDLADEFPGVRGLGFIERVPRQDLAAFVAREQADFAPEFQVKTSGDAKDLLVIKYIEPLGRNRPAWGFDVGQEARRRAAAERAIASGMATITQPITLVQDEKRGPGFLLYVPAYRTSTIPNTPEERRQELLGLFYSPIIAAEVLSEIAPELETIVRFELYSGEKASPDNLIFAASDNPEDHRALFNLNQPVHIGGEVLTLHAHSTRDFEASIDRQSTTYILVGGALLSIFVALTLGLLATGRQRAEALAQSMTEDLNRLAKVAQHTTNAVLITDQRFEILWANHAYTQAAGCSLTELIGTKPPTLNSDTLVDGPLSGLQTAVAKRQAFRGEILVKEHNGKRCWWDVDIQPQFDTLQMFTGFIVVKTDISERKLEQHHLQAALNRSEALLSSIYQHAIVSMTDAGGRITDANEAFCRTSGYRLVELIGQTHRLLKPNHHEPSFYADIWQTLRAGRPWRGEICNRGKQGDIYWADTIIAPLKADAESLHHYISIRFDITQQKAAQAQLVENQKLLDRAGRIAGFGAWEIDLSSQHLRWSAQMYAILECSPEEAPQFDQFLAWFTPESRQQLTPDFSRAIAGGDGWDLELRVVTARGNPRWVRSVAEHQGADRLVGTLQDITAMRESQQVQRQLLERLDIATASAGLGIWEYDLRNRQFNGDERMHAMHGLRNSLIPEPTQTWLQGVSEGDRAKARHEFEAVLQGERDFTLEYRTVWPSGEERLLKSHARLTRDSQGNPQKLYGVNLDITELKQAEIAMRNTTQLLETVLASASEISIIAIDLDLIITVFNRGAERLLGYSAEEMIGHQTPVIIHLAEEVEQRAQELSQRLGYPVAGPQVFIDPNVMGVSHEWIYVHKNGFHINVALVVTPMYDSQGKLFGYLGIASDITHHKQFERSLRLATELAEQGSQAKSQFLANMSHEIRTPMNAILGMLCLLTQTTLTGKQRDYVDKTQGAAKSLLSLINDILDFSKIEADKLTLDPHVFSLNTLLENLAVILAANLNDKPIELLIDLDPSLPDVLRADDMRLQQVLTNLASNAIKFTAQGEVVIALRRVDQRDSQVCIEFSVKDTGIGIAQEQQAHVFAGFSQAEASITRRYGGTGLGLAISQRLLNMMGGELSLKSELGQGSQFSFQLWLDFEPSTPAQAQTQQRLLIVDDHPSARSVLATMATSLGWHVDTVGSGESAVALVVSTLGQGNTYTALLVDSQMPTLSGEQTLQALQTLLPKPYPQAFLLAPPRIDKTFETAVLSKPLTQQMLRRALEGEAPQQTESIFTARPLEGLQILVVEDNLNNQQVAQELLSEVGAYITLANNGQEGVEFALKGKFDLVLMDLQMPVMDGFSAARAIRNEPKRAGLPIVAMTANALTSDRDACLEAGMNDHIGKPFILEQLVECILKNTRQNQTKSTWSEQPQSASRGLDDAHEQDVVIAVAEAVDMMGGRQSLYIKLFKKFVVELPESIAPLETLLAAQHFEEACRHMHTHKGLCATLGLPQLSALAAGLEVQLKHPVAPETAQGIIEQWRTAVQKNLPVMEQLVQTWV